MNKVLLLPNPKKNIPAEVIEDLRKKICGCVADVQIMPLPEMGADLQMYAGTDLLVVFGGDGTIIDVARVTASMNIPIVGVNFGHIGYMAGIEAADADGILQVIRGDFEIQRRMMLDVSIMRDGEKLTPTHPALNDVVLSNGPIPRLLNFDMYCSGRFSQSLRSDGIVIATPTGSSAYSMSAGGPVLDPMMFCICATPICCHNLNSRPIIYRENAVLEIRNMRCRKNSIYLSVDGKEVIEICDGDVIRISKSAYTVPLVWPGKKNFVEVLNSKLSGK